MSDRFAKNCLLLVALASSTALTGCGALQALMGQPPTAAAVPPAAAPAAPVTSPLTTASLPASGVPTSPSTVLPGATGTPATAAEITAIQAHAGFKKLPPAEQATLIADLKAGTENVAELKVELDRLAAIKPATAAEIADVQKHPNWAKLQAEDQRLILDDLQRGLATAAEIKQELNDGAPMADSLTSA